MVDEPDIPPTDQMLGELRAIVRRMPTQEEAERAIHIEHTVQRVLKWLVVPVVVSALFVPFGAYQLYVNQREATKAQRAIRCIVSQQAEHRATNQEVHDRMAEALHIPGTAKTVLPDRPEGDDLAALCAPFYLSQPTAERR